MAADRLFVHHVREVLRLHFQGKSQGDIARAVGCGKTTVREYLHRLRSTALESWLAVEALNDEELLIELGFKKLGVIGAAPLRRSDAVMPDWAAIHAEQARPSVTLALLWQEYREAHGASAYGYTQFCEHYRRFAGKLSVVMRQSHKAGEKAFVDYCDGLYLVDALTGERRKTQLFVGALGASSYTFAEATFSQTLAEWLGSHVKMFEFFGGVPSVTVPDNLRSAVTDADLYEPTLNKSYLECANHYDTIVIPARPSKPRDKAKVEAAVLVAQRWILARLRNRLFASLSEMNAAIGECLDFLNARKMRHLGKSRMELFRELDQPELKPLPKERYEFADWRVARANIDYHISFDHHHYSVPYGLVHEELDVRATVLTVEIFKRGMRIASHRRSHHRGKYTTNKEHMPASHRAHADWSPSRMISWGASIGVSTGVLVEKILESRPHPEQGYRSALGLIRLEKKYGKERVERAAGRALELKAHNYQFVAKLLQNGMDRAAVLGAAAETQESLPLGEENIRGSGYYH
jgi:transposase